ncbi:MAG: ABC transporter ATP-binding protein [Pseudomonadota bacterium]
MTQTLVQVDRLSKVFMDPGRGEIRAVDGIQFDAQGGQIFGLLGANGAGKTTTLRLLATVLRPSSGTARIAGHDVVEAPQRARSSLGFHSASTALYPRLTPRETLCFFARINGCVEKGLEQHVAELMQRFGISSYADARVATLSTGMKQRVAIARTVVHDPPVLIFDEPTSGLDVMAALELRQRILELRDQGRCVLLSTHGMSEAEKLCDRIAILHAGRILACDTLDGLRQACGLHYLEDIFVHHVTRATQDDARADPSHGS